MRWLEFSNEHDAGRPDLKGFRQLILIIDSYRKKGCLKLIKKPIYFIQGVPVDTGAAKAISDILKTVDRTEAGRNAS